MSQGKDEVQISNSFDWSDQHKYLDTEANKWQNCGAATQILLFLWFLIHVKMA